MRLRTRRHVLRATLGGAVGAALGASAWRTPRAWAQPAPADAAARIAATPLAPDLHLLSVAGTNVLARTSPAGTALVDGGPAQHAEALLAAVAALPGGGPVTTLFNTHWHPEQTGANERVGRAGGKIIAQENTRLWLTTDVTYPWDGAHFEPLPEAARPNQTFYDEGGTEAGLEFGYLRHAAHTDGDLYVKFPAANVLAVGGTVTGQGAGWPLVDWWTGGWIGGLVGNLELLLALADAETRVVPAHGSLLRRAELEAQYEMYNTIYERLGRMLNAGRGPGEAVEAKPAAEFDAAMGPSDEFVRRAFESLWAYLSPDA